MTDKLIEKINLGENNDDWGYIDALENRVLADANIIKAAEELDRIASAVWLTMRQSKLADELMAASDAFRAAVSERDG